MKVERQNLAIPYAVLALGALCIGFSAIFVKVAAVPGASSAFYRVLFASIVTVPAWLLTRPLLPTPNAVLLALLGGAFLAIDLALWQASLLHTSAANATLLANIAPVWVGIGALIVFRERLRGSFWLGLTIALAGITLVVIGATRLTPSAGYGDLLAVGASFFYALYFLTTQQVRASLDTVTFVGLSVVSGVVILLVFCLLLGVPLTGFSTRSWISLIALGLVSHMGGYLAISFALGRLRATSVSVTLLAQPVITALLSIPLLGERLSGPQILGGGLVLAGIYLVNRRSELQESSS